MERVIEHCCGLDVHKKTVVACVRVPGGTSAREQHVRTFGTTTAELLALRDWLGGYGVTHVAMESTGSTGNRSSTCSRTRSRVCWPTPRRSRRCQAGRRTSRTASGLRNCWSMGSCGEALCRQHRSASSEILTRYRAARIGEHTRETNRLQKVLEDAGIKLASVASNVRGVSGRAMLEALTQGTRDPDVLADLARGALRRKLPALRQALAGRFRPHHAFLVSQVWPTSTTSTR
jgi:transposase